MDAKRQQIDEAFLDAAVADALSSATLAEREAFAAALAEADEAHQETARELRETVTKMAAASPYMEPSAALRGRILQATADKPFKMSAYRRAVDVMPRWERWGMVAAVVCLVAGAWYNLQMKSAYEQQRVKSEELAALVNKNGTIAKQYATQADQLGAQLKHASLAITALTDEKVARFPIMHENKQVGVLLQDPKDRKNFMAVLPGIKVPPNAQLKITLGNDQVAVASYLVLDQGSNNQAGIGGTLDKPLDQKPGTPVQLSGFQMNR